MGNEICRQSSPLIFIGKTTSFSFYHGLSTQIDKYVNFLLVLFTFWGYNLFSIQSPLMRHLYFDGLSRENRGRKS